MPETNDKNDRPESRPMTPEQELEWARLADLERAESPDGKTGWDRLLERAGRKLACGEPAGIESLGRCLLPVGHEGPHQSAGLTPHGRWTLEWDGEAIRRRVRRSTEG